MPPPFFSVGNASNAPVTIPHLRSVIRPPGELTLNDLARLVHEPWRANLTIKHGVTVRFPYMNTIFVKKVGEPPIAWGVCESAEE